MAYWIKEELYRFGGSETAEVSGLPSDKEPFARAFSQLGRLRQSWGLVDQG